MRRLGLRAKLALVSLVLLVLPWAGVMYVNEMERVLLDGQERNLLATARAVATALHDRPQLLNAAPVLDDGGKPTGEETVLRAWREESIAPALLQVPKGYRKRDLMSEMER